MRLSGTCESSVLWREVRQILDQWFLTAPAWAAPWTLVVRAKTDSDDRALLEAGEAHDPTPCWAVFIDADRMRLTVAVPATADEHSLDTAHTAGFLLELLCEVANPGE